MNAFDLTEDQAITAITVGMDFGVDQVTILAINLLRKIHSPTAAHQLYSPSPSENLCWATDRALMTGWLAG